MNLLYPFFKKIAFSLDAELAHEYSLKFAEKCPLFAQSLTHGLNDKKYSLKSHYLQTSFPLGLAAGLDKNARCIDFFSHLGFGFVEVGTVTPLAQQGNSKPRLFRLKEEKSLLNRMGFNNERMDQIRCNLRRRKTDGCLGVNLGKNKQTTDDQAIEDYSKLFQHFRRDADYLVINISSPNTKGLRDLQNKKFLTELLAELNPQNDDPPLFLKLAPDLEDNDIKSLTELAIDIGFQGLIATNTCLRPDIGQGGVSGALLKKRAAQVRHLCLDITRSTPDFDFIGVGGVDSFEDLWEFWKLGGKHMQIYSAFIYQGPKLLMDIKEGIDQKLSQYACSSLQELLDNI